MPRKCKIKRLVRLAGVAICAAATSVAPSAIAGSFTTVLTFDELPFQPIDDLSIAGVTFDYRVAGVDSSEASYKNFGPGTLTFVNDPSLGGDTAGILALMFNVPTPVLEFGLALNTGEALAPGATVQLIDSDGGTIDLIEVDTSVTTNLGFSEALFRHDGALVAKAVIEFADRSNSFAIDNLTFGVPEPAAGLLAACALALLSTLVRPSSR
ncbi:hypothetical protein OAS39_06735 [Pirellulales bacterium]|nr:hypothetical protein [Pirellulales bacterium]